jgi:microcystin-dependent protein
MLVTNQTTQDLYFGPLHLAAGVGQQLTIDDTSATSLYLLSDFVADAVNNAAATGRITVADQAEPFPRPTGIPQLLHGGGSPDGLVYAPQGSIYMRYDAGPTYVLYVKTSGVTSCTEWVAVDTTGASVPTGSISQFAGVAVPTGWLLCDGAAYSQTAYAALFAAIVASKGTVTMTIASPAVFTLTNHGLVAGDVVYLETTGALPTGLSPDVPYYVISTGLTTSAFELSATNGGTAIDTSGSQSGMHTLYHAPYANANMGALTFTVPDLRGRVPVGYAASGKAEVAAFGGNDGLADTVRNISHYHTYTTVTHISGNIGGGTPVVEWPSTTSGDPDNLNNAAFLVVNYIIKI